MDVFSSTTRQYRLRTLIAAAASMLLASCASADPRGDHPNAGSKSPSDIQVIRIHGGKMDPGSMSDPNEAIVANECKAWKLKPQQAAEFFRLAKEYPPDAPVGVNHDFYQLPCSIEGQLIAPDGAWNFRINGAATATWSRGDKVRIWGCNDPACKPLVLLMPDGYDD